MKHRYSIALAFVITAVLVVGHQSFAGMPAEPKPASTVEGDRYLRCVVSIFGRIPKTVTRNGKQFDLLLGDAKTKRVQPDFRTVGGAGFVVRDGETLYLVTARHVAKEVSKTAELRMVQPDGPPMILHVGRVVPADGPVPWRHHDRVDVSVLPLTVSDENVRGDLTDRALPIAELDDRLKAPPRGTMVEAIGFPMNLGSKPGPYFNPISRYSRVAANLAEIPTPDNVMIGILLAGYGRRHEWWARLRSPAPSAGSRERSDASAGAVYRSGERHPGRQNGRQDGCGDAHPLRRSVDPAKH